PPTVQITYPGQDTTIVLTATDQPEITLQETHTPTSGQFEPTISWSPSNILRTADYYDQIEDSLVIVARVTATNIASMTATDSVRITLKKRVLDHFAITFEKDTVQFGQTSIIFVKAKDRDNLDIEPPVGTLVNIVLSESERYGFLIYGDTVSLTIQNVPYEEANTGNVLFSATNQDPSGLGSVGVLVGVTKVGDESIQGVDTVVVGKGIKIQLLVGSQTLRPLGREGNKKVIIGSDTTWVIDFTKVRSTTATVIVTDNLLQPVPNYPFTLRAFVRESSGGHDHASGRPTGRFIKGSDTLTTVSDATGSDGKKIYTYLSSGFGGVDSLFVKGRTNTDTASITIKLRIAEFTELTQGSHYELTGAFGDPGVTSEHRKNHQGTSVLVNTLKALADTIYAAKAYKLRINDMSLAWGGPFDIRNNWNTPHQTHREGTNADIDDFARDSNNQMRVITKVQLVDWLKKVNNRPRVIDEGNHFHITTR
ncbi:MAG TPA: hypothetical protein VII11_08200, partial [Bacteroidota bacterium]